jgi:2-polyprenyl-3-methyl-5-hydroxy-6-metoxy-1,4-benzoquinol methylase
MCFVNPLGPYRGENETEDYFRNDYLPLHLSNLHNSLAERRAHIAAIQRRFALPAHPRHLDVGCALGFMLQEAKTAGWKPQGVETSAFAAGYATEHTGCPVFAGTVQEAAFASGSFDVITLMDVIEHVAEPRDLVTELARILAPGGVLFIVTPNFGSLFSRLYKIDAYGIWPDQHVVYFEPRTISLMLKKAGFSRVIAGSKDFYAANLQRFLGKQSQTASEVKANFSPSTSLGRVRQLANRVFMHLPLGDKLLAFAQK